jgi:tetratricopeptide (TPR) repeat protein
MPKSITQYRVFIATPSGLDDERKAFQKALKGYSDSEADPRMVAFHPVGWEDTLPGVGRPQEQINEDLKQCDYAVFVWHDRWGSPTCNGIMVGTEEEWHLAEELYKSLQVRNILVFFKNVDERQLRDPGEQLKQVLAHKKRIEEEKRYLFKSYDKPDEFCDELRKLLARWLLDHEKGADANTTAGLGSAYELMESTEAPDVARLSGAVGSDLATADGPTIASPAPSLARSDSRSPNFRFWIEETNRLLKAGAVETANYSHALFCARKALESGATDLERLEAKFVLGKCQTRLNRPADALATLSEIATTFVSAGDTDWLAIQAKALISKALTLGKLGRREEAIAVYDDVIARFGTAGESALREGVARALVNKGVTLSRIGQGEEAIAVYDDVIARFGAASESALREGVARALVNKGGALSRIGRCEEAIAVYDDVIARFGAASELALRKQVAKALFNKGGTLSRIGRCEEAIAVYDDVIVRFGGDADPALKAIVADIRTSRSTQGSSTESQ